MRRETYLSFGINGFDAVGMDLRQDRSTAIVRIVVRVNDDDRSWNTSTKDSLDWCTSERERVRVGVVLGMIIVVSCVLLCR
jgi:hypothetical protein